MRILQVFRAPVGGLFRHVRDLAQAQNELGHEIGLVCDSATGGAMAGEQLRQLEPFCSLGIKRLEMSRLPGLGDAISARRIAEFARPLNIDIIHGHGAKGGAYARVAGPNIGAKAIYTAHGGSLHYSWNSPSGAIFLGVERMLMSRTAGMVFVCDYERKAFERKIGLYGTPFSVVHNGLWPHEFTPVNLAENATDILFIGELRQLKGVDVLLKTIARSQSLTATIVGDGPDRKDFETLSTSLGLQGRVRFTGAMPARDAFGLGRLMVIPSRAESFPYIVLEAIAAHKPLIASDVGGIGEVLPAANMVVADDVDALGGAINAFFANPQAGENAANELASRLKRHKNVRHMATDICEFYSSCLAGNAAHTSAA